MINRSELQAFRLVNICLKKKNEMIRKIDIPSSPKQGRTEKDGHYVLLLAPCFFQLFSRGGGVVFSVPLPREGHSLLMLKAFEKRPLSEKAERSILVYCDPMILCLCNNFVPIQFFHLSYHISFSHQP